MYTSNCMNHFPIHLKELRGMSRDAQNPLTFGLEYQIIIKISADRMIHRHLCQHLDHFPRSLPRGNVGKMPTKKGCVDSAFTRSMMLTRLLDQSCVRHKILLFPMETNRAINYYPHSSLGQKRRSKTMIQWI